MTDFTPDIIQELQEIKCISVMLVYLNLHTYVHFKLGLSQTNLAAYA